MNVWSAQVVAHATGAHPSRSGSPAFTSISTDTRSLEPGALFVALAGEHFDGHDYLAAAAAAGAQGAIVRRETPPVDNLAWFEVDDPLTAYGRLARHRRRDLAGPVVAVTGSNGKTSTKEMIAAGLRTRWKTHATHANLNNRIGVPQTILAAPPDTEALVLEAGANQPGEIACLRDIIEPTVAAITNVAAAHLHGFKTVAAVMTEKVSLAAGVSVAVVGSEPPELAAAVRAVAQSVVTTGFARDRDLYPDRWSLDAGGRATMTVRGTSVVLPVVGAHQAANALIALGVATALELDLGTVADALATVKIPGGRCEVVRVGDRLILNDTYNANPASVEAALATAEAMRDGRPLVIVLGTMRELGPEADALHRATARAALAAKPSVVGALGEFVPAFETLAPGSTDIVTAASVSELGRALASRLSGDECVLLKASRGEAFERLLPYLTGETDTSCSTTS